MEERTVKDLKQNFDIAAKEKATEVSLLDDCQGKIISLCRDFGSTFHELRETLDKLEKLSLRKTAALTDSKYIETLIKGGHLWCGVSRPCRT